MSNIFDEHSLETVMLSIFSHQWFAVCSCNNPDGEGVGATEFFGSTEQEAVMGWAEHLLEKAEEER